jgi:NADH-quinone oxidoreductase subunit J
MMKLPDLPAILFYVFSSIAVIFALMVILLRNPVTSALSLVASFFGVSGVFILLRAPFLGVIQILIYAGAILVLFLYVTMLLNIRGISADVKRPLYLRLGSISLAGLIFVLLLGFVTPILNGRPDVANESFGSIEAVGAVLLGPNALLFELVSLILLVGMIGTVVLSRKEREEA